MTEVSQFLDQLPILEDFSAVAEVQNYKKLPEDWQVVVADVKNSTEAIHNGKYKSVNVAGVSVITTIQNIAKPLSIPCVFGGDGASLCIPPDLVPEARAALAATRAMVKSLFELDLRVGIVPVTDLEQAGQAVLLARHRMSDTYVQTAFAGGGIEYAEKLVKAPDSNSRYAVTELQEGYEADYSGLECRWDNIPSRHGEVIAMMVKVLADDAATEAELYSQIITKMRVIYGDDEICHPLTEETLQFTYQQQKLQYETRIRTYGSNLYRQFRHALIIRIQNILGYIFMRFNMHVAGVEWGGHKQVLIQNTDFKKFDGTLRAILSGNAKQREELESYLASLYQEKKCLYGIHKSDSAIITCFINDRMYDHLHYVDGADGGYAMAAMQFKQQLKELER